MSLSRRDGVGTVGQDGLTFDLLPVYVLALVPRRQLQGGHRFISVPGLQFPATPAQALCGLCVRLAQCLLGNVVEVFLGTSPHA